MKLRNRFKNAEQAWQSFLEFSPGSLEVLAVNGILSEGVRNPSGLLVDKGLGKYRIEWKKLEQASQSLSRRWEILREWQRAELVRLGFLEFAKFPEAEVSPSRLTALAGFTLQTSLLLAQEGAPPMDRGNLDSLSVLALGKLGAADLNFFSDLDLIFFCQKEEEVEASQRLVRSLMAGLDSRGGSSIYRIDLRLRPEGDRGGLVPTQEGLEDYYAAYGEVWERCAWIRARQVAGEEEASYELLQSLQPFIYPRGLAPSSLGELFQQKSRAEDELVPEEDRDREIKRGRGGLREVEFPVLGLQLLHGAAQPTLQTHDLRKAIRNLKSLGLLKEEEAEVLSGGYDFWRRLEDRLQMRNIRQTHLLPVEQKEWESLAESMELSSASDLEKSVEEWRNRVRKVYDSIFSGIRPKTVSMEGVKFPETIQWDRKQEARAAWDSLAPSEELHATARTSENFQRLLPLLKMRLGVCTRPDLALMGLAHFTKAYGARSLLYESLCVNPKALELLIRFFEGNRAWGPHLVAHPELFEEVTQAELDESRGVVFHRKAFPLPKDEDSALEGARFYVRGQELRIALRALLGLANVPTLQAELTALAEISLEWAWEFAGKPEWSWVGLGKVGGEALSFGSDLDLLIVGEGEEAAEKAVRFLTADLSSGSLFRVDFRLRPYAEGALAVPVDRYVEYCHREAEGWEVLALCRARILSGAKEPGASFWPALDPVWRKTGQAKKFLGELREMRERIATERVPQGMEEQAYKTGRGGLMDIEFAAQAWQMKKGFIEPRTGRVLVAMEKEYPEEAGTLMRGLGFLTQVEWWLRMDEGRGTCLLPGPGPDRAWLAKICGLPSEEEFVKKVAREREGIRIAYEKVLARLEN
jgi:glutamate-ammonia-ligase adenylyltransferase